MQRIWVITAVAGPMALFASEAAAQNDAVSVAQGDTEMSAEPLQPEGGLNVIVVTAERRAENLQDVPVAVSALGSEALAEGDFRDATEIAFQVPGLQIKSGFSASNPTIFLRGVGINDFSPSNSGAVGVTVDDLFFNSSTGQLFQLYDLERVEVLKGPQGTLYGRNTTGGVVNFFTRKPEFEFGGYVTAAYGNYDQVDIEAAVNLPIADIAALRVSGVMNSRDGTRRIELPDGRAVDKNDVDFLGVRAQVLVEPSDRFDALFKFEYGQSRGTMFSYESQGLINPDTGEFGGDDFDRVCGGRRAGLCVNAFGYADDPDPFSGQENLLFTPEEVDVTVASLRMNADLGMVGVTSITAYLDTRKEIIQEVDASPINFLEQYGNTNGKQFSQELRVASQWGGPLSLIAGAFYLEDEIKSEDFFEVLAVANPTPGSAFFDPAAPIARFDRRYTIETETLALFAQGAYELTDRLTATLGVRYTWEDRALDHSSVAGPVGVAALDEPAPVIAPIVTTADFGTDELSFSELTWRAALDYEVADDVLVYGSVSKGFKSGGFNTGALTTPVEATTVEPEDLIAYEIGFKSEFAGRTVRLNGAAFYYDYTDLQVFGLSQGTVTTLVLFNANAAEIRGGEVELTAAPVDGLELRAAATYLDTEYTDYVSPGGTDFTGNRLVAAPEWSLNVGARYETPPIANAVKAIFAGDAAFTDDQFFDSGNTPRLGQEAYWLVNARIAIAALDDRWEVAAFAKNLTDRAFVADSFDLAAFGFDELAYGPPRTYGISLRVRLGD
ncbi:TonB-dependent receptor [Erythrobacter sp.]|uniref:TonB-dependent receptor n=1 Tax=Erythrobacter sp. TaxID=1042 RepID=UPI001B0A5E7B|nr:TonB-dependent receptor [Erythrobacter sp.]MBO6527557.1 TonB-dependent receptor [Erythrobacter sp.]MBO6530237.1 TonB-dependent receptor [Erythrobacter sp.]